MDAKKLSCNLLAVAVVGIAILWAAESARGKPHPKSEYVKLAVPPWSARQGSEGEEQAHGGLRCAFLGLKCSESHFQVGEIAKARNLLAYFCTSRLLNRQEPTLNHCRCTHECRRMQAFGTGFPWERNVRNGYCNTSDTSALELRYHSQPTSNRWCWRFILMNGYSSASVAEVTADISGQDAVTFSNVIAVGFEIGRFRGIG